MAVSREVGETSDVDFPHDDRVQRVSCRHLDTTRSVVVCRDNFAGCFYVVIWDRVEHTVTGPVASDLPATTEGVLRAASTNPLSFSYAERKARDIVRAKRILQANAHVEHL